jgi:signal transduction histidine kinase
MRLALLPPGERLEGTVTDHERRTAGISTASAGDVTAQPVVLAVAAMAAAGLSAAAIAVALSSPYGDRRAIVAAIHALLISVPVAVGIYAIRRNAASRFARLLIAVGFLWAPSLFAASDDSVLYSIGRIGSWLVLLSAVILILTFPSGQVVGRTARGLTAAAVALVAVLYLPTVLLVEHYPDPSPWSACRHVCPSNAFSVVGSEPGVIHSIVAPVRELAALLVFVGASGVLSARIARASRAMRRTLVPVAVGALIAMTASAAYLVLRRADQWSAATTTVGYIAALAIPGLVAGFLVGLIRWRIVGNRALRLLTEEFGEASSGSRVRDLIAEAIGDPSLEIAYWTGDPGHWADESGAPVHLPRDDPTRAVTEISARGRPVAALQHDPAHVGEPTVREVAGGFALMALENRRLEAELHVSLRELRESRARILHAVDLERQRIEHDLHDGAQQRLVALRVSLEVARETLEDDPEAAGDMLAKLGSDVKATLDEVRALARGVYPPLLADHGIGEALRMAARTSALPTTVRSAGIARYSQDVENAIYFCCLEALQNAAKHAGASAATITLSENDELSFEVRDDGCGFEGQPTDGIGLDNMRQRMAAIGGRLKIESVPGEGTTVTGIVPAAWLSSRPPPRGSTAAPRTASPRNRNLSGAIVDHAPVDLE